MQFRKKNLQMIQIYIPKLAYPVHGLSYSKSKYSMQIIHITVSRLKESFKI